MVTRQILSAFAAVGELYKLPDSKSPHPTRLHSLKSVCVKKIFFPHLFCRSMKPDIRNNNLKNTQIPLELFCVSNVCRNSFLVHVWGPRLLVYHMGDTVWHKDSLLKSSWQSLQSTKYDSKHTTWHTAKGASTVIGECDVLPEQNWCHCERKYIYVINSLWSPFKSRRMTSTMAMMMMVVFQAAGGETPWDPFLVFSSPFAHIQ